MQRNYRSRYDRALIVLERASLAAMLALFLAAVTYFATTV